MYLVQSIAAIQLFDKLLQCLGPCHEFAYNGGQWGYSLSSRWPSVQELEGDRLHAQVAMVRAAVERDYQRITFRFAVYGGIGSVSALAAVDLIGKIERCLGCDLNGYTIDNGTVPFPLRSSDRQVPVTTILATIVL